MSIVLIVIYCLIAAVVIFGLTFSQELQEDKQRKPKRASPGDQHRGRENIAQ